MALTKYTDTYCTVAEADASASLINVDQWQIKFTDAEKEKWLKAASKMIDRLRFLGSRQSDNQAMQFPRNFGFDTTFFYDSWFYSTTKIEERLAEGTSAQVAYMISPLQVGQNSGGTLPNRIIISDDAKRWLEPYLNIANPTNVYDSAYLEAYGITKQREYYP